MAIQEPATDQEFARRFLGRLIRNWTTLPSIEDFATWDEDDRADYLIEFRMDMVDYSELRRQVDAGELEPPERARLAELEELIERRTPEYERLRNPDD